MRGIIIALALAFLASPVSAQAPDAKAAVDDAAMDAVGRCNNSPDPDTVIAGCTALIQSGRETPLGLMIVYDSRGHAYEAKGFHTQAIADYTSIIALSPKDGIAFSDRGDAYQAMGLYDQAITDYDHAIAFVPDYANSYCGRGRAYEAKGLREQAGSDFRAALKIKPSLTAALEGLKRLGETP